VRFEQTKPGYPEYSSEVPPTDFAAFARACGAEGFRCHNPEDLRPAIKAALQSAKPAIVEVVVDKIKSRRRPTSRGFDTYRQSADSPVNAALAETTLRNAVARRNNIAQSVCL
jgi:TPP-dependent trihydroxycyclohexane-1,2-dione (THcHDO) dehydratase